MNNFHDYFFQTISDTQASRVLFLDESNLRAGINEETPAYDLEVATTIKTSNVLVNTLSLYNSNSSSNYHDTLYINTWGLHNPLPNSGFSSNNSWWGNNFSNTNINWDIRLRRNAPIHHSWVQADPLSNIIYVDKWGSVGALAGAISGGLTAAVSASTIYLNPLTSPSGLKAYDKAFEISGYTAGDDAIALGNSVGKAWAAYSAGLEGGKDGADAGRAAVENSLNLGIENEDSSLLGDTQIDAFGLGTAAGTTAALLGGSLPAWLGAGWFMKGKELGEELGKLCGTAVGGADLAKKNSNVLYPARDDATFGSNKSVWASNAANYGSNTSRWASNTAQWASNMADWSSNTAQWSSNKVDWTSNKVQWSSNKVDWTSNNSDWNSNKVVWSSNKADWSSNTAQWSSNKVDWSSNKVDWSSNTATAASNRAFTDRFWTNNLSLLYTLSNVSIGKNTNASLKLDIDGAIHIGGETSVPYNLTQGQYINWNNGTTSFINSRGVSGGDTLFQVYNGLGLDKTIMKLDGGGYVGINTTTPAYDLDVNGTINGYGLKENEVALTTKYALSNQQSNYVLSNEYVSFSNWTNSQYGKSNMVLALSNTMLALSNALLTEKTRLDGVNTTQDTSITTAQTSANTANTLATTANAAAATAQATGVAAGLAAGVAQTTANTALTVGTGAAAVGATNSASIVGLIAGVSVAQGTADFASNALPNYATSNMLSNVNSNFVGYSNWSSNQLSNLNSNLITFSNWTNTQYARSNQLSNYTLSNVFTTYSNSMRSNIITSNLISMGSISIGTSNNLAPLSNSLITANTNGTTFFGTTTSNMYLFKVINTDVDVNSNQDIGGIVLRNFNTAGSANYQFPDRQLYGLGFVVRNGVNSNTEALTIDNIGRLGVGTSNPTILLDINGSALCRSNLTASNASFSNLTVASNITASNIIASNITTSNIQLFTNVASAYPFDLSNLGANGLRVTSSNNAGDFRGASTFIQTSSNNPCIASFLAPNTPTTGTNRASIAFGRSHNNTELVQWIYNHNASPSGLNYMTLSFWGGCNIMNWYAGGAVTIGTFSPTGTSRFDVNGDVTFRSNLTTSNISACNITASSNIFLAGTSIYTLFAPSNQLSNYALSNAVASYSNFVNTQYAPSNQLSNYAPSNQLSNYTLGTTLTSYSNFVNTQYALSNAMSNWNFASNTAVWNSNNFANYSLGTNLTTYSNFVNTQYAPSNTLSNVNSNFIGYSNWSSNQLSNLNSNLITFSNWTNTQYARSNQLSNYTLQTTFNSYSNYADGAFRKTSVNVPWGEISGKPNFSSSNDSLDIGGITLGTAGLVMGGLSLLSQNGQLASMLQSASGLLKLNPSGYSRMDEGLKLLGDGTNGITLDPSGSISALTGAFNYSSFAEGLKVGLLSLTLSNDLIIWSSNTTSNSVLSSNAHITRNSQPFTFSNANVIFANCNIGLGTTTPQEQFEATGAVRATTFLQTTNGHYFGNGWKWTGSTWSNYTTSGGFTIRNGGSNENFQISTGSNSLTQQLTILANGNTGIGTNNPSQKLDINGNANVTGTITQSVSVDNSFAITQNRTSGVGQYTRCINAFNTSLSSNEAQVHQIGYGASSCNSCYWGFVYGSNGWGCNYLTMGVYSTDRVLNILGTGNVGIGTTAPSYKLDVNGTINATNYNLNGGSLFFAQFNNFTNSNSNIPWYGVGTTGLTTYITNYYSLQLQGGAANAYINLNQNGNIGVGTSNPNTRFDVGVDANFRSNITAIGATVSNIFSSNITASNVNFSNLTVASNITASNIVASNISVLTNAASTFPFDLSNLGTYGIRVTSSNNIGDFRGASTFIQTSSNNPCIASFLAPNTPTTGTNRASIAFGRSHNNTELVQFIYNHIASPSGSNYMTVAFWGGCNIMNWYAGGAVTIGTFSPTGTSRFDVNGDVTFRSNLTTSNISACNITASSNITLQGTTLYTLFAPSNQLSNYAPSNAMSNWNFASNTSIWSSNAAGWSSNQVNSVGISWTSNTAGWSSNAFMSLSNIYNNRAGRAWIWTASYGRSNIATLSNVVIDYDNSNAITIKQVDTTGIPASIAFDKTNEWAMGGDAAIGLGNSNRGFFINTQSTDRVNIDSVGNVGIGVYPPSARLHSSGNGIFGRTFIGTISGLSPSTYFACLAHRSNADTSNYGILMGQGGEMAINCGSNTNITFSVGSISRASVNSNGHFITKNRIMYNSGDIGATTHGWSAGLTVNSNFAFWRADDQNYLLGVADSSSNVLQINRDGSLVIGRGDLSITNRSSTFNLQAGMKGATSNASWTTIDVNGGGTYFWEGIEINGTMTAVSKSFTIKHPLNPNKKLIHASVEAPQADLIYSGTATLTNGLAFVNIDTDSCKFSPMEEGTFVALTMNPRFFLQNKTGFTALKGILNGNVLSIIAQNQTDDEVFWSVIAERKDAQIIDSDTTTAEGHLKTEVSA